MALAPLSAMKTALGIAVGTISQDALLQQCLDAAEEAARSFCKRPGLVSPAVTYTLYFDGNGVRDLLLPHRPVTAITSVYEDPNAYYGQSSGAFASNTLLTEGTDFVLLRDQDTSGALLSKSGILRKLRTTVVGIGSLVQVPYGTLYGGQGSPRWIKAPGSIKVTFSAGYPAGSVPADLEQAVIQIAAMVKRITPQGGLFMSSESLGSYSYSIAQTQLNQAPELGTARQILSNYRDQPPL